MAADRLLSAYNQHPDSVPATREYPDQALWPNFKLSHILMTESTWWLELAQLALSPEFRGEGLPKGHGEKVMILPGALGNDLYLSPMRVAAARMGFEVIPSEIDNIGET